MSSPLTSPDPEAFYQLIGKIIVGFNKLETLLRRFVAYSLKGNSNLAVVVLSRAAFSELVEMFKLTASFSVQSRPDRGNLEERIRELATALNAANSERNKVVHSHYEEVFEFEFSWDDPVLRAVPVGLFQTKISRKLGHALNPAMATTLVDSLSDLESVLTQIEREYENLRQLLPRLDNSLEQDVETE